MNNAPNAIGPRPWTSLSFEGVEVHRNIHCPLYEGCIDVAESQRWESFTCAYCPMNKGTWTPKYDEATFIKEQEVTTRLPQQGDSKNE